MRLYEVIQGLTITILLFCCFWLIQRDIERTVIINKILEEHRIMINEHSDTIKAMMEIINKFVLPGDNYYEPMFWEEPNRPITSHRDDRPF